MAGFDQVSPLRIDREVRLNCQIFRIDGILDVFSEPTFRQVLGQYVAESPRNFILDFSFVDLIDSSASGMLVDLCKQIQRRKGTLQIVGSPRIQRVIKLLRLDQFLALQPSLQSAIDRCDRQDIGR